MLESSISPTESSALDNDATPIPKYDPDKDNPSTENTAVTIRLKPDIETTDVGTRSAAKA